MSHFSKIRTELREEERLREALDDLGFKYELGGEVGGYAGQRTRADIVIRQEGGYDIGFVREGDTYKMVADLWGLKADKDKFLQQVTQRYAYRTVIGQARTEGFSVVDEEQLEDGSIRIVCERAPEEA